ncbi:hypothetical protein Q0N12_14045 [Rossellomorea marisflavi]|uniref:hypothetical protein n=1 Tax=Rossellomorea marisflavi TaxID=189381 RepID=UPI00345A3BB1
MRSHRNLFLIRGTIFLLAFVIYHVSLVFSSEGLQVGLSLAALLLFLTAIIGTGRFYSGLSIALLFCSIAIVGWRHSSWVEWLMGFSSLIKLIFFIGLIPLISFPIGGVIKDLKQLMVILSWKVRTLKLVHYGTFLLSNLINLAALPVSKILFVEKDQEKQWQAAIGELTGRSFGLAMMLTPIGAAIAVAMELTGTRWLSLLPVNLLLAAAGLWLSYSLVKGKVEEAAAMEEEGIEKPDYQRLSLMLVPLILYFAFLLTIETIYHLGIMEIIVISVLPFTLIWSLFLRKGTEWFKHGKIQMFKEAPKSFGLYGVIISASLFIYSMEITGLDDDLISLLPFGGEKMAFLLYIPATILIVEMLSLTGVHQFIGMLFAAKLIDPVMFGIHETVFASALLVGFVSGMQTSTFSGANILLSTLLPSFSSYEIGRRNYVFALLFIPLSTVVLIVINIVLTLY